MENKFTGMCVGGPFHGQYRAFPSNYFFCHIKSDNFDLNVIDLNVSMGNLEKGTYHYHPLGLWVFDSSSVTKKGKRVMVEGEIVEETPLLQLPHHPHEKKG